MQKDETLARAGAHRPSWLAGADRSDPFVVGAAIGAGMIAQAAERGGADFLLALGVGRIRVMGAPSVASMLPTQASNRFVPDFARTEIIGRVSIPVVLGLAAFDPALDVDAVLLDLKQQGFAGVTNFPSLIHAGDRVAGTLDRLGLGFDREVSMLGRAGRLGLGTVAYVRHPDQALAMAAAGVDLICLNFGWNVGGVAGAPAGLDLAEAAREAEALFGLVRARRPDVLCVAEGGPIDSPESAAEVCRLSRADGYIGGSTIDRLPLEAAVSNATSAFRSVAVLSRKLERLQDQVLGDGRRFGLIGRSPALRQVVQMIERFGRKDLTILVTGPNGTGKELVAQAIHAVSPRAERDMIALNCAAIPRELLESELFGYEKGAFTGAARTRLGRFDEADGSTLFLDEIGDLELALQAKLLRVLEAGTFERLGANQVRRSDVRIVCATNRNLTRMVSEGTFREDLYYRLNKMEIRLPALAERIEDIPLLVEHTLQTAVRAVNPAVRSIDGPALRLLMTHTWPGNVRELKNVLERAAILCDGERIGVAHLPPFGAAPAPEPPAPGAPCLDPADAAERTWILAALERHRFRRGETARALGISRKTLFNKIGRYGLG
jgi:DNA-binding NtrC family response regulator/predicted TIM-barrel enzyme